MWSRNLNIGLRIGAILNIFNIWWRRLVWFLIQPLPLWIEPLEDKFSKFTSMQDKVHTYQVGFINCEVQNHLAAIYICSQKPLTTHKFEKLIQSSGYQVAGWDKRPRFLVAYSKGNSKHLAVMLLSVQWYCRCHTRYCSHIKRVQRTALKVYFLKHIEELTEKLRSHWFHLLVGRVLLWDVRIVHLFKCLSAKEAKSSDLPYLQIHSPRSFCQKGVGRSWHQCGCLRVFQSFQEPFLSWSAAPSMMVESERLMTVLHVQDSCMRILRWERL